MIGDNGSGVSPGHCEGHASLERQRQRKQGPTETDVLVVGGGIAGLWIQQRLLSAGFTAVLVEQQRLGGSQSGASQGIIHGGVKYALGGRLTGSTEVIASMPGRWRRCIEGQGEVDLRGVRILTDSCHLWTLGSPASALASLLDSQALRRHVVPLTRHDHPACFRHEGFHGTVYRLDELVLDPVSLVRTLATPNLALMLQLQQVGKRLERSGDGFVLDTESGPLHARHLVLAAGSGNPDLLENLGLEAAPVQRRPLHQVCVTLDHPEPLYGHCVTSLTAEQPELTVTSHPTGTGKWLLYLGGRLADTGVSLTPAQQISAARDLMAVVLPGFLPHLDGWRTLRVDRVESIGEAAGLPETPCINEQANVLTVWPNKMSLIPELADQVLTRLGHPAAPSGNRLAALTAALGKHPRPALSRGILEWMA